MTAATAEDTGTAGKDVEKVGDVSIPAAAPVVPKVCDVDHKWCMIARFNNCLMDIQCKVPETDSTQKTADCAVTAGCAGHADAVLLPGDQCSAQQAKKKLAFVAATAGGSLPESGKCGTTKTSKATDPKVNDHNSCCGLMNLRNVCHTVHSSQLEPGAPAGQRSAYAALNRQGLRML